MVEPFPPGVDPPSTSPSIFPPSWESTSAAVEHSGAPERFALVAVNGPPSLRDSSLAIGWPVRRMPIVPLPAVSFGETAGEALNRIVTGPGQKRSMRVLPSAEMSAAKTSRCFRSPITTRIG